MSERWIGGIATVCRRGVVCAATLLLTGAGIAESARPPRPVYGASTVCSADFITGEAARTPPILVVHVVNVFGEPLADTALTLRQPSRDGAIKKMTTAAGRGLFEDARVGGAELVAELRGFAWVQVRELTLQRGCTTAVTIPLVVADVVD